MINIDTHIKTLEEDYTINTDLAHRKKFAQFFTPQPIADLMSDWLLENKKLKTILEPAFGLGIFTRNLLAKKNDLMIKGFDVDNNIFSKAEMAFINQSNINLQLEDYMLNDWENKYDGIICNPPYFKFHDYENKKIIKEVETRLQFKLNGFANLYTLFLLKSIHQLADNGRAAYIIPSEFLNADYGKLIKKYLIETNTLRHLFVINFKENVFPEAITTACILLLANDKKSSKINISTIESKSDLQRIKSYIKSYPEGDSEFEFNPEELDHNIKWRQYYQIQNSINYDNLIPLSNFAKVVRGIATGANDYFKFSKSKAEEFAIPAENLLPCICKAKDVKGNFFTAEDFEQIIENNNSAFLFNGIRSNNEAVKRYILKGVHNKINEKFLTKNRNPWYSLEQRPPAPIWVSVFNRNGIKFIRNEANIANLTTFHCVYPTNTNLFSDIDIDLFFAYLLTDVAHEIFNDNRREYGNGLKKFEPNDLNKAKMLNLSILEENDVNTILQLFKQYKQSQTIKWIEKIDAILRKKFSNS